MKVGTVQRDSSEFYVRFLPENLNRSKTQLKDIIALNPVCTDQTMRVQTDLSYLLQQNPDISGLSLILDDVKQQERLDYVQFEDFMEPKTSYDIFDFQQFVEKAKKSFDLLPVKFRMEYQNNPFNFISAFNDPLTSQKTIAALAEQLNRKATGVSPSQSGETSNVLKPSPTEPTPAPDKPSSTPSLEKK